MKFASASTLIVIVSAVLSIAAHHDVYLNITAVTHINGESALQCWQLPAAFRTSLAPGTANRSYVLLGDQTSKATLTVIPAGLDGGLHHAEPQWVYFVTGLAHITLPLSSDQAWINGGRYGLLWAGDGANVSRLGHRAALGCSARCLSAAGCSRIGDLGGTVFRSCRLVSLNLHLTK